MKWVIDSPRNRFLWCFWFFCMKLKYYYWGNLMEPFDEKKSGNGLTGLPNFKKATAILILALANYLLDTVSPRGPTIWNRRENFRFWGSQMVGKCISQSCSMDISLCQSTSFSVLCTMKYPFTCFPKKASPNVCPI